MKILALERELPKTNAELFIRFAEEEARKAFTDERACVVRPGLIVGPMDNSDRFTYWPVRIDRGGDCVARPLVREFVDQSRLRHPLGHHDPRRR